MPDPLIIGCGTGRCGTASLAGLLRANGIEATHERYGSKVPYKGSGRYAADLLLSGQPDVALYWIWYYETLLADERVRMICLRRDLAGTVESYLRKTPKYNHWQRHPGTDWEWNEWDLCYPKYQADSKAQALCRYWMHYYDHAERLQDAYPDRFRIFELDEMNSATGQAAILRFAGIEDPNVWPGIRLNRSHTTAAA